MTSMWIVANVVSPLMVLGAGGLGYWWLGRQERRFEDRLARLTKTAE